jgi:hypothetical protein
MKILVTGASNGMGKGVAKVLAERDDQSHEVIMLCRSKQRGEAAVQELSSLTKNDKISLVLADLSRLGDVRNAIAEIRERHDTLDGLFVNAGLGYAAERIETDDGMDSHFQVNYLSQFMLLLNLLELLERSECGGRVVFNVTEGGEIFWDDLQMKKNWSYVRGIRQAMVAKRMLAVRLHELYAQRPDANVAFIGFQIPKTVWTNQINLIPSAMKAMASLMKLFGLFISIERCGEIMAPLFTDSRDDSAKRSGKFLGWKNGAFAEIQDDAAVFDRSLQEKLWETSLRLCADDRTAQIAERYTSRDGLGQPVA